MSVPCPHSTPNATSALATCSLSRICFDLTPDRVRCVMQIDAATVENNSEPSRIASATQVACHFTSFKAGLTDQWEGYKADLRKRALDRLQPLSLTHGDVGTGSILERLIGSIEIPNTAEGEANNLVQWTMRWGRNGQAHRALLSARNDAAEARSVEEWAVKFYRDEVTPQAGFEYRYQSARTAV